MTEEKLRRMMKYAELIADCSNNEGYYLGQYRFPLSKRYSVLREYLLHRMEREMKSIAGNTGLIYNNNNKETTMEELKQALVAEVGKQLNSEKPNIQYLDVLNRLLGTVLANSERSK